MVKKESLAKASTGLPEYYQGVVKRAAGPYFSVRLKKIILDSGAQFISPSRIMHFQKPCVGRVEEGDKVFIIPTLDGRYHFSVKREKRTVFCFNTLLEEC